MDDIVNEYNNTYIATKMKPFDIKDNTYFDSIKEEKLVIISEYKNIFAKGSPPNSSEEIFVIKTRYHEHK